MSFVVAAPEQLQAAAENLAGIRSMLAEASASVAVPTTGVVPAAADEVSAAIAAMFGNFGQKYQFLSAQMEAFHAEFVDSLSAGAGAYLSTEIANAEQILLNAVGAPVQGLLGQSIGAVPIDPAAAADSVAADLVQDIYLPLHGLGEAYIASPLGKAIDPIINAPTQLLFHRDLIGNGIAGTLTHPNGGPGGFLFGDGGAGLRRRRPRRYGRR